MSESPLSRANAALEALPEESRRVSQMLRRVLWIAREKKSVYDIFDEYMSTYVVVYGAQGTEKKDIGDLLLLAIDKGFVRQSDENGEDFIQASPAIVERLEAMVDYDQSPELLRPRAEAVIAGRLTESIASSTSTSCKCTSTSSSALPK